jgi:hypothetical protein
MYPPRKAAPGIGSGAGEALQESAEQALERQLDPEKFKGKDTKLNHEYDPVCKCVDASLELSELVAEEIAREDRR